MYILEWAHKVVHMYIWSTYPYVCLYNWWFPNIEIKLLWIGVYTRNQEATYNKHFLCFSPSICICLRKPNACQIGPKIFKIGDLKPYHVALILSRQHTNLNEQSLMVMGGELYEIRRRSLQNWRLSDTSDSLQMKLAMTKELQSAEKRWRDRLLQILSKGQAK